MIVSAAQSVFQNQLVRTLLRTDPNIDAALVLATGATDIRASFNAKDLVSINIAYMAGLRRAFAIGIAMGGAATVVGVSQKWLRLNKQVS